MNSKFSGLIAFLLIFVAVWLSFNFDAPQARLSEEIPLDQFSTSRAFQHVEAIAQQPHYVGSSEHPKVRNYIVQELQKMDLEVQTQEDYFLNSSAILSKPQNILARIKGSGDGDALILMTHYDSATHSSPGASDAGSGVATILEGIRAFREKKTQPKNDIILLFTDAEEIGLIGAEIFVKDHPWAKDVLLALNFEARGSGGNPFMLLETNGKNAKLIEAFADANVEYPVSNSLAYSIYKMLPNDTDLTVLREKGNINGYNFAFIDDHFDYHTANDTPKNLDAETLAHQGSYLMPLLAHFSEADLKNLSSDRDLIYFNLPFGEFVKYPFDWISPMLIVAMGIFLILILYGIRRDRVDITEIFKGFLPMLISISLSGLLSWAFWQFCLFIYPEYSEMEHGFTYNGYWYIALIIFLSLSISFITYHWFRKRSHKASIFIAPLALWLVICTLVAVYLKGAAYFIIPVFFGLLQLFVMVRQKRPNRILMVLLSFPAIILLLPFIWSLPVALGLKTLFITAILGSLVFMFLLPLFGYFRKLKSFAVLCFLVFNILLFTAHYYSDFSSERPKPNSLVYLKDLDQQTNFWYSYDEMEDSWTSSYFPEGTENSGTESNFSSKYGSNFRRKSSAPEVDIPEPAILLEELETDTLTNLKSYSLKIAPNRDINRLELYETRDVDFKEFRVNDLIAEDEQLGEQYFNMHTQRWKERILTYYASNRDTLRIEFAIAPEDEPEFVLYESAYDLFENEELKLEKRPKDMIPRPFVLNDATILKKTIRIKE